MKQSDHIIFIESDEIGLFLAENILSDIVTKHSAHYFPEAQEALYFIRKLGYSPGTRITVFVNAAILMREHELIKQIKDLLLPFPSRFCLITSMPEAEKREKKFTEEIGLSCFIGKPLTEEKFIKALEAPFDEVII